MNDPLLKFLELNNFFFSKIREKQEYLKQCCLKYTNRFVNPSALFIFFLLFCQYFWNGWINFYLLTKDLRTAVLGI